MSDTTLQIRTVRARLASDNPGARLGVERALGAADLYPPGLPAGAVLIVRRLEARPAAGPAWQRAARARLAELARSAARPARGDSAATAEAVLFADAAELLACLADDIARGAAPGRWWWRSYLRGAPPPPDQLPAVLAATPRALPAALALLATRGHVADVLAWLPPPVAHALAARMAETFRVGPLPPAAPAATPLVPPLATPPLVPPVPPPAPWPQALPGGLAREQQLLLGLALTLHERHAAARAPAFRQALAAWWATAPSRPPPAPKAPALAQPLTPPPSADPIPAPQVDVPERPAPGHDRPAPPARQAEAGSGPDPAAPTVARRSAPAADRLVARPQAPAPPATPDRLWPAGDAATPMAPPTDRANGQIQARPGPTPGALPPGAPAPRTAYPGPDPAEEALTPPAAGAPLDVDPAILWPAAPPAGETRTEVGGALFLINLLIHLDLPEQFAAGWGLDARVGAWGLLELFARALLADPAPYAVDPLWALLARLDGRDPGAAPGERPRLVRAAGRPRGYRRGPGASLGARAYRIPAAWLRRLPADPGEHYFWASAGRRLRVWSSRGFVLFDGRTRRPGPAAARAILTDLGLTEGPLARAASQQRSEQMAIGDRPTAIEGAPAWLRRWLGLVLPYARLRLALALGLADPADDLGPALLTRRGLISASATHIDLTMDLAAVNLLVRLAGLDRNPGWIGEYGRVIGFHFVDPGEQEVYL